MVAPARRELEGPVPTRDVADAHCEVGVMINEEQAQRLLGRDLLDRDGNRVGEITQVFVNDQTMEPTWVTVTTGWFEWQESFVPLHQVGWSGEQLRAAYDTATIKAAPLALTV